jgi:uncharacterized membrane protein
MNPALLFATALTIGFFSGLRAFTPLALVSWLAVWGWLPLAGSHLAFLGTTAGAVIVLLLALGELIGDKLPITPARIQPGPLLARLLTGAMCGAAVCLAGGKSAVPGAICGALGGIIGAYAGYHARRAIVRGVAVRDFFVAFAEDLVAIGGSLLLLSYFFSRPL